MKILLITQYYWPEYAKATDIAETLKLLGNEVTVLTGLPNYPEGRIYDGYRKGENRNQIRNGVNIIRVKLFERKNNLLSRLMNYYSFSFFAKKKIKSLDNNFDVVLAIEESPIMLVKPAIKYAKKHKVNLLMYEMDLWPESILAGGIKRKSLIYKHYLKVSSNIYSNCSKILVSTYEHIDYIHNLPNCSLLDIGYLPQYAEESFEKSGFQTIDNGIVDLMFAGNIGKAQSVDTIINTAELLKDNPKFLFHIVGAGSELKNVMLLAEKKGLDNVVFYGNRPFSEMKDLYKMADIMLVTLENKPYANLTIPGKVQSYLAFGKPVLGAINGSTNFLINNNNVGIAVESGDFRGLASAIKNLTSAELNLYGKKAKEYYFKNMAKKVFFRVLIDEINKLKK